MAIAPGLSAGTAGGAAIRWHPWWLAWACVVLPCYLAYALYIGLSLPIDYYIYHDYAALQMSQNRLDQDLFPAGIQSYLNPTGFALLELLLRLELSSWWISLTFAALHSFNALFVFLICGSLAHGRPALARRALCVGGFAGAVGPMILSVVGTSFLDPLTSAPVLAALWLLLRPSASASSIPLAAFLAGAATGLKLSNLPFALAIAVLVVFAGDGGTRGMAKRAAFGALSMWAGLLATHGWWSWQLWQRFGNPLFPSANGFFQSPWAPAEEVIWPRFVPHEALDFLSLPFRMALPVPWVYTEAIAPDFYPFSVLLLAVAVLAGWIWRRRRGRIVDVPQASQLDNAEARFWIYLGCAWPMWMITSSNGRYALPLLLLTGIAVALLALRVFDHRRALAVCLLLLLLQVGNTSIASAVRWSSGKWTPRWLTMDVPLELREAPMLFVSADGTVKSALARRVHPESGFVQLVGATYSVPSVGTTGEWLQSAIARRGEHVRALFAAPRDVDADPAAFGKYMDMLSRTLDRAGLAIDASSCVPIAVNDQPPAGPNFNPKLPAPRVEHLWACGVFRVTPSPALAHQRHLADEVFSALEARCPDLYRPAGVQTEGDGRVWTRVYTRHDALIVTVNQRERTVAQRLFGQAARDEVASLDSWQDDIARYDCSLPLGGIRGAPTLRHINFKKRDQ